jgi:hypothetical protein
MKMDDYKNSDNFQRTEGFKMISPHHFHPTNGVSPSDSKGVTPKPDDRRVDFGAMWRSVSVRFFGYVGENVLLLDVVPSRRRRRRGGRRR